MTKKIDTSTEAITEIIGWEPGSHSNSILREATAALVTERDGLEQDLSRLRSASKLFKSAAYYMLRSDPRNMPSWAKMKDRYERAEEILDVALQKATPRGENIEELLKQKCAPVNEVFENLEDFKSFENEYTDEMCVIDFIIDEGEYSVYQMVDFTSQKWEYMLVRKDD